MAEEQATNSNKNREHWNAAYGVGQIERLGWHEEYPEYSIKMFDHCAPAANDLILDVGSGTSTLIRELVGRGHGNVAAADISDRALASAQERLGRQKAESVQWIVDDVLQPTELARFEGRVKVWHDRAVFHFLVDERDRRQYLGTLRRLVAPDAHVIMAAFSLRGVDRCSGLPVRRYSAEMIADLLGPHFRLLHSFECVYSTPGGEERPYVYTLFARTNG